MTTYLKKEKSFVESAPPDGVQWPLGDQGPVLEEKARSFVQHVPDLTKLVCNLQVQHFALYLLPCLG
jgi:hypothetical protein